MSLDGQRPSTCTPGVVDLVPPTDTSRQRERNHPSMGAGSTLSFEREVSRQTRVLFPPRGGWIQSRRRRRSVGGQCQRAFIWGGTLTNRLGDIRRGGTRMRGGDKVLHSSRTPSQSGEADEQHRSRKACEPDKGRQGEGWRAADRSWIATFVEGFTRAFSCGEVAVGYGMFGDRSSENVAGRRSRRVDHCGLAVM